MKPLAASGLAILLLLLTSCGEESSMDHTEHVKTIEQEHLPNPAISEASADSEGSVDQESVALPFSPPISMDPVDGSKVSIRRSTPTTEYAGKIYHFSSEENLKLFLEQPMKYLSGGLSNY